MRPQEGGTKTASTRLEYLAKIRIFLFWTVSPAPILCRAMRLNEAKLAEVQRRKDKSGESTKKYLLDKIDKYWLEGEIFSKINQLRDYQARQFQDPVNRLEHEIKKAVDDDDMPRAARAAEELKKETYQVDLEKMNRKLKSECKYKRIEDENLKNKDLIAYLEARLAQQVRHNPQNTNTHSIPLGGILPRLLPLTACLSSLLLHRILCLNAGAPTYQWCTHFRLLRVSMT